MFTKPQSKKRNFPESDCIENEGKISKTKKFQNDNTENDKMNKIIILLKNCIGQQIVPDFIKQIESIVHQKEVKDDDKSNICNDEFVREYLEKPMIKMQRNFDASHHANNNASIPSNLNINENEIDYWLFSYSKTQGDCESSLLQSPKEKDFNFSSALKSKNKNEIPKSALELKDEEIKNLFFERNIYNHKNNNYLSFSKKINQMFEEYPNNPVIDNPNQSKTFKNFKNIDTNNILNQPYQNTNEKPNELLKNSNENENNNCITKAPLNPETQFDKGKNQSNIFNNNLNHNHKQENITKPIPSNIHIPVIGIPKKKINSNLLNRKTNNEIPKEPNFENSNQSLREKNYNNFNEINKENNNNKYKEVPKEANDKINNNQFPKESIQYNHNIIDIQKANNASSLRSTIQIQTKNNHKHNYIYQPTVSSQLKSIQNNSQENCREELSNLTLDSNKKVLKPCQIRANEAITRKNPTPIKFKFRDTLMNLKQ